MEKYTLIIPEYPLYLFICIFSQVSGWFPTDILWTHSQAGEPSQLATTLMTESKSAKLLALIAQSAESSLQVSEGMGSDTGHDVQV